MKKLSFIFIVNFTATYSLGQIEEKANAILSKGNFAEFVKFADKFSKRTDSVTISMGNRRELVSGFQESWFYISKAYPYNKAVSITCETRLKMLTKGNRVIYYFLESKSMKQFPRNVETSVDTVYHFRDSAEITELKNKFQQVYMASLNEDELFTDTIYYGQQCGHGRNAPLTPQQIQIRDWVKRKDSTNLLKWLQSTITEKQVFAVQGFNSLAQMGIRINPEIKRLIEYVLKKKGTINTCGVCDANRTTIASIAQSFYTNLFIQTHSGSQH